jgi:hypothetical protein
LPEKVSFFAIFGSFLGRFGVHNRLSSVKIGNIFILCGLLTPERKARELTSGVNSIAAAAGLNLSLLGGPRGRVLSACRPTGGYYIKSRAKNQRNSGKMSLRRHSVRF